MTSISKQFMLEELLEVLKSEHYVFFTQYQGLTVSDFSELRRKLEGVADRALAVKNTIARLAFEKMGVKEVNGFIKGSVLLALGSREPQAISKVLVDFAKDRESFRLAGACLDGELYGVPYLQGLAALPPREALLSSVVTYLNAPIGGFVTVMGQLIRSLAVVLDGIRNQKSTQT